MDEVTIRPAVWESLQRGASEGGIMTESQKRAESTRGRFEEWASNRGWDVRRCENGVYANSSTELLWIGWKAAVQPATCLTCKEPLSSNGLIAWCDNGHVWELPEHNHDTKTALHEPCNDNDCEICAEERFRG